MHPLLPSNSPTENQYDLAMAYKVFSFSDFVGKTLLIKNPDMCGT